MGGGGGGGGGDDDGGGLLDMILEAFRTIKKIGLYVQSTWVGEVMRRTPGFVLVGVMVYVSAASAAAVVKIRMSVVKDQDNNMSKWVLAPDMVFGAMYLACVVVIAIICIGLVVWPWASGVYPMTGIFGALASVAGVYISILFDQVIRLSDSSTNVYLPSDMVTRLVYLHTSVAFVLAVVVSAIPSSCPYDSEAPIAMALTQRRRDMADGKKP